VPPKIIGWVVMFPQGIKVCYEREGLPCKPTS
jgi:hypothetical protein